MGVLNVYVVVMTMFRVFAYLNQQETRSQAFDILCIRS